MPNDLVSKIFYRFLTPYEYVKSFKAKYLEQAHMKKGTLRICEKGHKYYKSTDCPACPVCEKEKKPKEGFLSTLGAPARRALENQKILTEKELSKYSKYEILKLHGIGPSSIPGLEKALAVKGLSFRK